MADGSGERPERSVARIPVLNPKERILEAARENQLVTYRGIPIRLQLTSQKKLYRLKGISKKYSKS